MRKCIKKSILMSLLSVASTSLLAMPQLAPVTFHLDFRLSKAITSPVSYQSFLVAAPQNAVVFDNINPAQSITLTPSQPDNHQAIIAVSANGHNINAPYTGPLLLSFTQTLQGNTQRVTCTMALKNSQPVLTGGQVCEGGTGTAKTTINLISSGEGYSLRIEAQPTKQ